MSLIREDLTKTHLVPYDDTAWVGSPQGGVLRYKLDRRGEEVGRVTSLVLYEPNSYFPAHTHGGGEEYLVLKGCFNDPLAPTPNPRGRYVQNHINSRHAPSAPANEDEERIGGRLVGCVIFVKLGFITPASNPEKNITVDTTQLVRTEEGGMAQAEILAYPGGRVWMEWWSAGVEISFDRWLKDGGVEILIIEGKVAVAETTFETWSWWRISSLDPPPSPTVKVIEPTQVFIKRGHLP